MVNSKGGFLVEDDGGTNDDLKTKERERERERAMHSLEPRTLLRFSSLLFPFHFHPALWAALIDASRHDQLST